MNRMMGRLQRTIIYLITLIIATIGTGAKIYAFPVPADRTSPVYRAARNETGQPEKRPGRGDPEASPPPSIQRDVNRSRWTGKWISVSPSQLGFKQEALEATVEQIGQIKGIYSIIVVRNGYLAVERYFREGHRSKPHNLKSASKSVLSALIGIAIDEGYLGLNQPISEILPQAKILNDPRKAAITVRHLLTMTSGLSPTSYQAYNAWVLNRDWVKTALDRPLITEPGTHFNYSTGDSHLLSAVLTAATGMSTQAFALEKLFNPMSITIHGWETDPKGIYQGGNNLSLIPLDMAKIGLLYLNRGKYGDRQLVPKQWVDVSIRTYYKGENDVYGSYGYLWFSQPGGEDAFVAVGYGGQYIYVSTPYDCVIVITATLASKGRSWERQLFAFIQNGILGNIQTDQPQQVRIADLTDAKRPGTVDAPVLSPSTGQATRNVNLRSDASQQSKRIGLVPKRKRVYVLETRGRWYRVKYGKKEGWLHSDYVAITSAQRSATPSQPKKRITYERPESAEPLKADIGLRNGRVKTRLNLRKGPSKDDPIIAVFDAGTPLEIKEQQDRWLLVQANNLNGWVFADYVRIGSSETIARSTRQDVKVPSGKPTTASKPEQKPEIVDALSPSQTGSLRELQNVVVQLQNRLSAVEKDPATQSLSERNALKTELTSAREKQNGELIKVRWDIENQRKTIVETGIDLKAMVSELASANQNIERLNRVLTSATTALTDVKAEQVRLGQERDSQQKTNKKAVEIWKQLAEALALSEKQQAIIAKRLHDSDTHRQALTQNLAKLQKGFDLRREGRALSEAYRQLQATELAGIRNYIAMLRENLKIADGDRKTLDTELTEVKNALTYQQQALVNADTDQKAMRLKLEEMRTRMVTQDDTLKTMQIDRDRIMNELVAARKRISTLEAADSQPPRDKPATPPIDISESSDAPPAPMPLPRDPDVSSLNPFVQSWAAAWGRKDVRAYLSHYSKRFQPAGGISLTAWYKQREKRLLKPAFIKINISNIRGEMLDQSRGKIIFNQMYRSETYMDRVTKTLDIQWENGEWKIVKETSD